MDKIVIYPRADLEALAKAGIGATPRAEWLADMRSKVAGMVKARPAVYRTFGPYWWPVKAQLVAAGLMAGESNSERVAQISSGDDVLDMAGAVAFHGFNIDSMRDGNTFEVDTESGDMVEYVLADEDMDAKIG